MLITNSTTGIFRVVISRRLRLTEHVARVRELENAYVVLVRIAEERTAFGRPRRIFINFSLSVHSLSNHTLSTECVG
jgi:hypothetical protein